MVYTQNVCTKDDARFLRKLPLSREVLIDSTRFYLVHSTPMSPILGYCREHSESWREEVASIHADILVVGHTHTPFIQTVDKTTIVNPGSLGQPKTGRPLACYAVWEDGQISLREYAYPLSDTIEQIRRMPVSNVDQEALTSVLETGALPGE
jgi:protein phosphatase